MMTAKEVREQVLAHLEILASLEQQKLWKENVPIADVPAEMFCGWFDDLDLPNSASTGFTGPALEDVHRFSDLLDAAASQINGLSLAQLHQHPMWLEIVNEACTLLLRLRVQELPGSDL